MNCKKTNKWGEIFCNKFFSGALILSVSEEYGRGKYGYYGKGYGYDNYGRGYKYGYDYDNNLYGEEFHNSFDDVVVFSTVFALLEEKEAQSFTAAYSVAATPLLLSGVDGKSYTVLYAGEIVANGHDLKLVDPFTGYDLCRERINIDYVQATAALAVSAYVLTPENKTKSYGYGQEESQSSFVENLSWYALAESLTTATNGATYGYGAGHKQIDDQISCVLNEVTVNWETDWHDDDFTSLSTDGKAFRSKGPDAEQTVLLECVLGG